MKKAFTMLELVFVIVVIGILAAAIIPSTRTNPLQEAAVQVLSHIRYTQHLAMMDDKYDANNFDSTGAVKWYKERWQILFSSNGSSGGTMAYTIFSDTAGDSSGNPEEAEIAINPSNQGQRMTGGQTSTVSLNIDNAGFVGMNRLNIGRRYGVTNLTFSASCNTGTGSTRMAFDHMGRPIQSNLSSNTQAYDNNDLIQADCNIILTHSTGDTITIRVQEETGYSCILNAAGACI